VPHQFDEEKQAQFIKDDELLKSTLAPDERLLFMDVVHPTQATKITAGWIKKGEDKAIKTVNDEAILVRNDSSIEQSKNNYNQVTQPVI